MEIKYVKCGDYYIPNLALPEETRPIGKWGRIHREYLKVNRPITYTDLILSGKLWTYLADLNEQAQNRLQLIIRQIQEAESVTDEFKENDQIAWIKAMNSIRERAEEIVLDELVYT